MSNPFKRGQKDGQWTEKDVKKAGFDSARECLDHQESELDEEADGLPGLHAKDAEAAKERAQYLKGVRSSMRESLRKLLS